MNTAACGDFPFVIQTMIIFAARQLASCRLKSTAQPMPAIPTIDYSPVEIATLCVTQGSLLVFPKSDLSSFEKSVRNNRGNGEADPVFLGPLIPMLVVSPKSDCSRIGRVCKNKVKA